MKHFYHVYADGLWQEPVREHLEALDTSGFNGPVLVGVVGSPDNRSAVKNVLRDLADEWVEADAGWEHLTLEEVRKSTEPVLYAHTKGAANPAPLQDAWRRSMTKNLISGWREADALLASGYDTVGCHWLSVESGFPQVVGACYGGNFWAARPEYLRTLPSLCYDNRHWAEGWLGESAPKWYDLNPGWPGYDTFK